MKYKKTSLNLALTTLLCSSFIAPAQAAQTKASPVVSSYETYYAYKTPNKKGQSDYNLYGIYGYFGYKKHSLELGYDGQDSKAYTNGNPVDVTAVYSNYMIPNVTLKIGLRDSDISDKNNQTNVYILGAKYTKYNYWGYATWNTGIDVFYNDSKHNKTTSGKVDNPDAIQFSPYYGGYIPVKNHPADVVYAQLKINTQSFDKKTNTNTALDIKNTNYTNAEARVSYIAPKWSLTGIVYAGTSYNLVEKGGFVFNNDYHTYENAAAIEGSYTISKKVFVKPWIKYQAVKKTTNQQQISQLITTGAILGFSF